MEEALDLSSDRLLNNNKIIMTTDWSVRPALIGQVGKKKCRTLMNKRLLQDIKEGQRLETGRQTATDSGSVQSGEKII